MELPGRFAAGDIEAFEALFRQLQSEVYGWIVRNVRDPGIAEYLTVETCWRINRARARFDPTRNPVPWARRIATNVALDYLKGRKPEAELPVQIPGAVPPVASAQSRDLWPEVLTRFDQRVINTPWYDWAMLALLVCVLFLFPGFIPVLLYHL